jgi:glycosyltransferase involved in cell wall biosynthesis
MNILLIHQNFLEKDDGGGSRFNEMTRYWESQGHHITVLAGMVHHATGTIPERYKGKYTYTDPYSENRTVIRCKVSAGQSRSFFQRLMGYFSFAVSGTYAGLFKARKKYDVIISTSPPLFVGIPAFIISFLRRIPLVFEVRDLWPESAIDTGMLTNSVLIRMSYWFEKFIYRRARLVNALTPAFQEKIVNNKGIPADKVIMIPNASDFSLSDQYLEGDFDREAYRKKLGIEDKVAIIYVGAHGIANHLIQVIETAERLKDREEVVFLLIGNGAQKPMLIEETEKRGLKNVLFFDSVPKSEVFKFILASDFGATVLKKVDTFKTIYSNKTFDYMACQRPVLMVVDGVSRKLIEDAQCGLYIEPENIEEFEGAVREVLDMDRAQWREMGMNGYHFAKANFDREALAEKYLDNLHRLAGKKKNKKTESL